MATTIGFLIGVVVTFLLMSIIGEKIMNDTYMEGFLAGQKDKEVKK